MSYRSSLSLLLIGSMLAAPAMAAKPIAKDPSKPYTTQITTDPNAKSDSDMKAVLAAQKILKPQPIEKLTPAEARLQPSPADGAKLMMKEKGIAPITGVSTKELAYGKDAKQKARVYIPEAASGALPVVVYYHGGGWVIADLDTYDATPRAIAKQANAIVVSVEYRHAPEAKFPAAHDDAFTAYQWVLAHAKSWGGDPAKVAVMGESAGGNLAINTAIAARDAGVQQPVYQVLVYPVAGTSTQTESYLENEYAKPLNKAMMLWFVKHTIRGDADKDDPRLDILGKANLKGLAPATIITAEIDPLRSDGQALADKLRQAGVPVDAVNYEGVTHEFFGMAAVVEKARQAQEVVVRDLTSAFKGSIPSAH